MESEGKILVSSPSHSKVSATHTHVDDEQGYEFPSEGFSFTGRTPSLSYPEFSEPIFPHGYIYLA